MLVRQFEYKIWQPRKYNDQKLKAQTKAHNPVQGSDKIVGGRAATKMAFRVFFTMHYLKSQTAFLICINRKLQKPSGILHCQKQRGHKVYALAIGGRQP